MDMYINGRFLKMKKKRKNYQYDMQKYNGIKKREKRMAERAGRKYCQRGVANGHLPPPLILSYLFFK